MASSKLSKRHGKMDLSQSSTIQLKTGREDEAHDIAVHCSEQHNKSPMKLSIQHTRSETNELQQGWNETVGRAGDLEGSLRRRSSDNAARPNAGASDLSARIQFASRRAVQPAILKGLTNR